MPAIVRLVAGGPGSRRRRSCAWPTAGRWSSWRLTLAMAALAWLLSGDPVRGAGRAGRRHAVPADPGRAGGDHGRHLGGGAARRADQGRRRAGDAGPGAHLVFDKTGTLTTGDRPAGRGRDAGTAAGRRAAAAGGVARPGVAARAGRGAIVAAARARGLPLPLPEQVRRRRRARDRRARSTAARVRLGGLAWVAGTRRRPGPSGWRGAPPATAPRRVFVAVDGGLAGALLLADEIRPETPRALRALRRAGHRADRDAVRRPAGRGRDGGRGARRRQRAGRALAGGQGRCGPGRARPRR